MCWPCCHPEVLVVCHGRCQTYTGDTGVVTRLDPKTGELIWTADLGSVTLEKSVGAAVTKYRRAVAAAVDSDGNVFVAWDLGPHDSLVLQFPSLTPSGFTWSTTIPNGGLAKLDSEGNQLWLIDFPEWLTVANVPKWSEMQGSPFSAAASVAVAADGKAWVATHQDINGDWAYRINPDDGTIEASFGHAMSFSFPNVWPADNGRSRLEVVNLNAPAIGKVFALPDGKIILQQAHPRTMIRMNAEGAVEFAGDWTTNKSNYTSYGLVGRDAHHAFGLSGTSLFAASPVGLLQEFMYQSTTPSIAGGTWPWEAESPKKRPSDWFNANYNTPFRLPGDGASFGGGFPVSFVGMSTYPLRKYGSYVTGHPGGANEYGDDLLYDFVFRVSPYQWSGVVESEISLPPLPWNAVTFGGVSRTWDWADTGNGVTAGKTSLAVTDSVAAFSVSSVSFRWRSYALGGAGHSMRWGNPNSFTYLDSYWNVFGASTFNGAPQWAYLFGMDRTTKLGNLGAGTLFSIGTAMRRFASYLWPDNTTPTTTLTADFLMPAVGAVGTATVNRTDWMIEGVEISFGTPTTVLTSNVMEVVDVIDATHVQLRNTGGVYLTQSQQTRSAMSVSDMTAISDGFCIVGGSQFVAPLVAEKITIGGIRVWQQKLQPTAGLAEKAFAVAFGGAAD